MKQAIFAYVNNIQYCSWNKLHVVLSNEGKVSCYRKQLKPLMELELMTERHSLNTSITRLTVTCHLKYWLIPGTDLSIIYVCYCLFHNQTKMNLFKLKLPLVLL